MAARVGSAYTATSVCSLSDNPPSLLVCMNRSSRQNAPLKTNGVLCVNILAPEHRDLSAAFAGVGQLDSDSRFRMAEWTALQTGAPVLKGAIASFDCKIVQALEINTHMILICDVVGVQANDGDSSLIYFKRGYRDLVPPDADAGR